MYREERSDTRLPVIKSMDRIPREPVTPKNHLKVKFKVIGTECRRRGIRRASPQPISDAQQSWGKKDATGIVGRAKLVLVVPVDLVGFAATKSSAHPGCQTAAVLT